jgi:DNA-directed RNA polymerase subunit RPC12/RpoP
LSNDPTNSDTQKIELESQAQAGKFCALCGKNVAGHRRFKDSRGYICLECGRKEEHDKIAGTIKCPDCKRRLKPGGFIKHDDRLICKSCFEHIKQEQRRSGKVSLVHHEEHERQRLYVLLGVFLVIATIVGWRLWVTYVQ